MTSLDFSGVFETKSAPEEQPKPTVNNNQPQTPRVEAEPVADGQTMALQQEIQERERMREVLGIYQDNVKKVAALETQIIKAIIEGEPIETILLMALDAIGRTTGDNKEVFMNACVKALNEREKKNSKIQTSETEEKSAVS